MIGGVRKTARAIGRDPSAVSKWQKLPDSNGVLGIIPRNAQLEILTYAKKNKLDISANDLILGRNVRSRT